MTDATADFGVGQARGWANKLISANHRGPGDTVDAAIHRASVKHGLDPKVLWRLRYRTPKDMLASVYLKIQAAYAAECERQEARLAHEIAITKAITTSPAGLALVDEAQALLAASSISALSAARASAEPAPAEAGRP